MPDDANTCSLIFSSACSSKKRLLACAEDCGVNMAAILLEYCKLDDWGTAASDSGVVDTKDVVASAMGASLLSVLWLNGKAG